MFFKNLPDDELTEVSPIGGRYNKETTCLRGYFSEFALIYHRWCMEINYLLALNELAKEGTVKFEPFTPDQLNCLKNLMDEGNFTIEIAERIKASEKTTNHDVKSIEYILKEVLTTQGFSKQHLAHVHFGLTSEDVNNISYARMLMTAMEDIFIPAVEDIHNDFLALARENEAVIMLAHTHGQPATPTTFGKEMQIFAKRIKEQLDMLYAYKIRVKVNGASGNYNGHYIAYPDVDWPQFMEIFINNSYGYPNKKDDKYVINNWTNQIEDHDTYSELFAIFHRINTIVLKFTKDMWLYISMEYISQKPKAGEIGSSAMPHKINPIKFENAEGNAQVANALIELFNRTLPDSRLQRHLSDSTIIRNFGTMFGHILIAYKNLAKGLDTIEVNKVAIVDDLNTHPEVISEAYQLILKREGYEDAYETLKKFTRGKKQTLGLLHEFIDSLEVNNHIKDELKSITPEKYIGLALRLATGYPVTDQNYELKNRI